MEVFEGKLVYLGISTAVAAVLFIWIRWWLMYIESRRAKRIQKLEAFEAVKTNTPVNGETTRQSRKVALEGLETRFSIVRRTILAVLVAVWVVAVIVPFVGRVPGTLISLMITAGAVVVGIAARPVVENFIAGFVLTFSKQFHTGDTILIDKEYGTIEDVTATHTVVKLWDWRRYIVPNSRMLGKEIINYSTRDSFLWAKLEFFVAHDADLELVEKVAVEIASKSRYFAGHEPPKFWVMGLEKESVKCWLAMWVGSPMEAWSIRVEVGRVLVETLNKRGIKTHAHIYQPSGGGDGDQFPGRLSEAEAPGE